MTIMKYVSMSDAIEKLKLEGYEGDFVLTDDRARHSLTREEFLPEDLIIIDQYRFEGKSNPDDMAVLYVVESRNGVRGTIVDAFGTYADADLGRFLQSVERVQPSVESL